MSVVTLGDVRKQLSLLGYTNVPDQLVRDFLSDINSRASSIRSAAKTPSAPTPPAPAEPPERSIVPPRQTNNLWAVFEDCSVQEEEPRTPARAATTDIVATGDNTDALHTDSSTSFGPWMMHGGIIDAAELDAMQPPISPFDDPSRGYENFPPWPEEDPMLSSSPPPHRAPRAVVQHQQPKRGGGVSTASTSSAFTASQRRQRQQQCQAGAGEAASGGAGAVPVSPPFEPHDSPSSSPSSSAAASRRRRGEGTSRTSKLRGTPPTRVPIGTGNLKSTPGRKVKKSVQPAPSTGGQETTAAAKSPSGGRVATAKSSAAATAAAGGAAVVRVHAKTTKISSAAAAAMTPPRTAPSSRNHTAAATTPLTPRVHVSGSGVIYSKMATSKERANKRGLGFRKSDPVRMHSEYGKVWKGDSFLGSSSSSVSSSVSTQRSRSAWQQRDSKPRRPRTADSTRGSGSSSSRFVGAPTDNRRDALRWQIRMQMASPPH
eukprot:COSAG01_NODE_758_length_13805_cov_23.267912_12_plen_488_part_00